LKQQQHDQVEREHNQRAAYQRIHYKLPCVFHGIGPHIRAAIAAIARYSRCSGDAVVRTCRITAIAANAD
jgi:hypothetical protein